VLHGRSHEEWRAAISGDPMAFVAEDGESWLDVQRRATAYLREQILPAPQREILIVAHGGVNRGIIASLTGISMGEAWQATSQDNTCVNLLELNGDGSLLRAVVKDTTHLMEEFPGAGPGQRWVSEERRWEILATVPPPREFPEA
jgi:broad specificity phosphatase PhoE